VLRLPSCPLLIGEILCEESKNATQKEFRSPVGLQITVLPCTECLWSSVSRLWSRSRDRSSLALRAISPLSQHCIAIMTSSATWHRYLLVPIIAGGGVLGLELARTYAAIYGVTMVVAKRHRPAGTRGELGGASAAFFATTPPHPYPSPPPVRWHSPPAALASELVFCHDTGCDCKRCRWVGHRGRYQTRHGGRVCGSSTSHHGSQGSPQHPGDGHSRRFRRRRGPGTDERRWRGCAGGVVAPPTAADPHLAGSGSTGDGGVCGAFRHHLRPRLGDRRCGSEHGHVCRSHRARARG